MRRALAVVLVLLASPLAAELAVPFLSGRVNDLANMVPDDARQRIEQKLAAFEQKTGAQVAVLTVPSLEGEPIEDFSMRVVEAWKLGRKEKDNGVLFLVAQQDRRMRIEVGYGLEGDLTDLESNRILDDVVAPYFRNGDFGGGIEKGVDAILASLQGQEVVAPESGGADEVRSPGGNAFSGVVFAFVIGVFSLMALTTAGAMGWILYFFMMPFLASFGIPVLIGWVILFPILKLLFGRKLGKRSGGRGGWWGGGGPFLGGGGWGGGGGWSGGGGGGFSGGGGSFGGGGSSGSW
ncbi:MAG: YgcG family protein [Acidobacteriota bacterium]